MSTVNYKEDYAYAQTRLSGTVVKHNDRVVLVNSVNYGGQCDLTDLLCNKELTAHLNELDLSPVKLGYMNMKEGATYVMRAPIRYYKQGLTHNVIKAAGGLPGFLSSNMVRTILGMFPHPLEAAECVHNKECSSMAFSRVFAFSKPLKKSLGLEYKSKKVGSVTWNEDVKSLNYNLDEEYEFLRESLEEALDV